MITISNRSILSDKTYDYIMETAVHTIIENKIQCIPLSGFELATRMNIKLIPYSKLSENKLNAAIIVSEDGFLLEYYGQYYIYYDDFYSIDRRQNWTILHEIGHIVLDHIGHNINEENEANFFAKYIIAPPILIREIKAKCPEDVYNNFFISKQASEYSYEYFIHWQKIHEKNRSIKIYEKYLLDYYKSKK